MSENLQPGHVHTVTIVVDEARAISFMGPDARVYATPNIVEDLEYACRDLLLTHLPDGQDSVGAHVDITHLRPTPIGFSVTHTITIESLERRRARFAIDVHDGVEVVARASHTRMIVDVARMVAMVTAKQNQAK